MLYCAGHGVIQRTGAVQNDMKIAVGQMPKDIGNQIGVDPGQTAFHMINIGPDFGQRHRDIIGRRRRMGAVQLIGILAQPPQIGLLPFGRSDDAGGSWVAVKDFDVSADSVQRGNSIIRQSRTVRQQYEQE